MGRRHSRAFWSIQTRGGSSFSWSSPLVEVASATTGRGATLIVRSSRPRDDDLSCSSARSCGGGSELIRVVLNAQEVRPLRRADASGCFKNKGYRGQESSAHRLVLRASGADRRADRCTSWRSKRALMEASVVGKTFWSGLLPPWRAPELEAPERTRRRGFCAAVPSRWRGARSSGSGTRWSRRRLRSTHEEGSCRMHAESRAGSDGADAGAGDRLLERALSFIDDASPEYAEAVSMRGRSLLIAGRRPTPCHFSSSRSRRGRSLSIRRGCAARSRPLLGIHADRQTKEAARVMEALEEELRRALSRARAEHLGSMSDIAFTHGYQERAESHCAEGVRVCDELGIPLPATLLTLGES